MNKIFEAELTTAGDTISKDYSYLDELMDLITDFPLHHMATEDIEHAVWAYGLVKWNSVYRDYFFNTIEETEEELGEELSTLRMNVNCLEEIFRQYHNLS